MLAGLGRVDVNLLALIRHRGAETQANLAVNRGRDWSTTAAFAGKRVVANSVGAKGCTGSQARALVSLNGSELGEF